MRKQTIKAAISNHRIVLLMILAGLLLLSGLTQAAAYDEDYEFSWCIGWNGYGGPSSANGEFKQPSKIAFNSEDNFYVVDCGNSRIQKFDSDGNYITKWTHPDWFYGSSQFNYPFDIVIDSADNVYVLPVSNLNAWDTDKTKSTIKVYKFNKNGTFIKKLSFLGYSASSYLTIDPEDHLFIGTYRYHTYNDRRYHLIKFDNNGNILIDKYSSTYAYIKELSSFSDTRLISCGSSNLLNILDENFDIVNTWNYPTFHIDIDLDQENNVYTVSNTDSTVQKFDENGNLLTVFGGPGWPKGPTLPQFGKMNIPQGLAVDSVGNIYVADTFNHRVQKFTRLQPPNQPPIANAGPDQVVTFGNSASFNGSASSDPDGTIVFYNWDFGDGTTGSGMNPSHTYATPGPKTVTLTVTDDQGATDTDTLTILVNQPPIANAGPDMILMVNETTQLSGAFSFDPDGTIVSYNWNFGDGTYGSGPIVEHRFVTAGTCTATLTVTDNHGATDTDELCIIVLSADMSILELINDVRYELGKLDLPPGIPNSYIQQLTAALNAYLQGDTTGVIASLGDFCNHLAAQNNEDNENKKIPGYLVEKWTDWANRIIKSISYTQVVEGNALQSGPGLFRHKKLNTIRKHKK